MSLLDHWHPVLLSRELKRHPLGITIADQQIAVFRGESGTLGAISDVCPHRRMRLSLGRVVGDCLRCEYHGWTFSETGDGESPGTPKMRTRTLAFDVRESNGVIWIKSKDSEAMFPDFDCRAEGFQPMVLLYHDVDAPLELVLDNFNELEHTPTTHSVVGFPLERMHEVQLSVQGEEDHVRIHYHGPCRKYPWLFRQFLQLGKNATFHVQGQTRFSPIHTWGDYHWTEEATGRRSWVSVRNVHILTPLTEQQTRVFTFSFMKLSRPRMAWILPLVRPFMRRSYLREINEDKRMLDNLADKRTEMHGQKLSRFDRPLLLNRERIDRIYRRVGKEMARSMEDCEATVADEAAMHEHLG